MTSMFSNCLELTELNLLNFNTENVTSMEMMFDSSRSLKTLDLSSFKTPNLQCIEMMFSCCRSLTYLNISNFTMGKMENLDSPYLFADTDALEKKNIIAKEQYFLKQFDNRQMGEKAEEGAEEAYPEEKC